MYKTLLFVAAAVAFASAHEDVVEVTRAIAVLNANGISGNVTFTREEDDKIRIGGRIIGMKPGMYGFHIHEKGDLSNGCASALGHFNPNGNDHGHPHDENRHVGDLGNIEFDSTETANLNFLDHLIKLNGRHNIIGRAVVLHSMADDFGRSDHPDSKVTGNAGGRVACGVIGIMDYTLPKANAATTSSASVLMALTFYTFVAALM
ncbi:unnamed protein product [Chrysodeixis includens]|uniref:Superoxide dismutase [Cu-Zn] n=1 Tax=Chrysodeixis includens TaxID=689277 RepID=A0A9P0FZ63_CHRIL|nr:unnamed protein product [Chrysodeixis includens]